MTVRYLLSLTAMIAIAIALLRWNLGVGAILLASIPFGAFLFMPRKKTRRKQRMHSAALVFAAIPVYILSFAPFTAAFIVNHEQGPAPPWVVTTAKTFYAPHVYLLNNNTSQPHFLHLLAPQVFAWEDAFEFISAASPDSPISS